VPSYASRVECALFREKLPALVGELDARARVVEAAAEQVRPALSLRAVRPEQGRG
jgi:hypothetical protein